MNKQEVTRDYSFSDAELVAKGKEKAAFIKRDSAPFATFGVTAAMITALETSLAAFSNSITDIEAASDQSGSTSSKDAKADELRVAISAVMSRAEYKYGVGSARYKKFGTTDLSHQSDAELAITAKRVVRVGTTSLTDLATAGLTTAMLTTITTLVNAFEILIVDQKIKIGDRDIIQEDRVEAGNAIYKTLVDYAKIGRAIWATSDVAKYNDYTINETPPGEVPPAVN